MNKEELKTRKIAWQIIKKSYSRDQKVSDISSEIFKQESDNLSESDKRFITNLVQGSIRMSGRLDWEIKQVFKGDYSDLKAPVKILLRLGVYQIMYMDSIPDYAAVATTVQLAKRIHNKLGGLANAILRTIIKESNNEIPNDKSSISDLSEYYSHPEWLFAKWIKDYSLEDAISIAKWNNKTPNIWFRVNKRNYDIKLFKKYLDSENITYETFNHIPEFVTTSNNQELLKSKLFKSGKISVQDPSAGLVVHLIDPQDTDEIADVCAAPGGKTTYISEYINKGFINASDSDKNRLSKLKNNIIRLDIDNIEVNCLDITVSKINKTSKILVDAPCTGTGVMSKKADIRWRRSVEQVLEMHLLQRKILWSAAKYVKDDGILVYSTCSIEPEENYMVIDAFLKTHTDFSIECASKYIPKEYVDDRGAMVLFPPKHNIDGGFAIRLRKNG